MSDHWFGETISINNILKYYYALRTFALLKLAIGTFRLSRPNIHCNKSFLVNWEYIKQTINPRMK